MVYIQISCTVLLHFLAPNLSSASNMGTHSPGHVECSDETDVTQRLQVIAIIIILMKGSVFLLNRLYFSSTASLVKCISFWLCWKHPAVPTMTSGFFSKTATKKAPCKELVKKLSAGSSNWPSKKGLNKMKNEIFLFRSILSWKILPSFIVKHKHIVKIEYYGCFI